MLLTVTLAVPVVPIRTNPALAAAGIDRLDRRDARAGNGDVLRVCAVFVPSGLPLVKLAVKVAESVVPRTVGAKV